MGAALYLQTAGGLVRLRPALPHRDSPDERVATTLSVLPQAVSLVVGQTREITAQVLDQFGDVMVGEVPTLESSDTDVVTVAGLILTADDDGSATVTASYPGLTSVLISVTVFDVSTRPRSYCPCVESTWSAPVDQTRQYMEWINATPDGTIMIILQRGVYVRDTQHVWDRRELLFLGIEPENIPADEATPYTGPMGKVFTDISFRSPFHVPAGTTVAPNTGVPRPYETKRNSIPIFRMQRSVDIWFKYLEFEGTNVDGAWDGPSAVSRGWHHAATNTWELTSHAGEAGWLDYSREAALGLAWHGDCVGGGALHCKVTKTWSDPFLIGGGPTTNVGQEIGWCQGGQSGRHGLAVTNGKDYYVHDNFWHDLAWSGVDVEPNAPDPPNPQIARDGRFIGNTYGSVIGKAFCARHYLITIGGKPALLEDPINILIEDEEAFLPNNIGGPAYNCQSNIASAFTGADISASSADNSYNSTSTDFTTRGLVVGQLLRIGGFTNAANNGFGRIVSIAANKLVMNDNLELVDEAAGLTITMTTERFWKGLTIRNCTVPLRFGPRLIRVMDVLIEGNALIENRADFFGLPVTFAVNLVINMVAQNNDQGNRPVMFDPLINCKNVSGNSVPNPVP